MLLIRLFEERLLELFSRGFIAGTTHACIGQEADAVAVMRSLEKGDVIFSNHRCHGHYLARFDDPLGLLAEIMGRVGGICGGRGGSQHLYRENFYTSGVQGGFAPISVGMALAEKLKGSGAIAVAFIGDGTLGQGVVYESLNLASLLKVPLLIVIENNAYAQTTPLAENLAGSISERVKAFGISCGLSEGADVEALTARFSEVVEQVRRTCAPHVEVIDTYRLCAHSKGDDYRDADELLRRRELDPLCLLENRLPPGLAPSIRGEIAQRLDAVEETVRALPEAPLCQTLIQRG
ncbi:MAG: thiamine pyrophosphate-dependent dehydrogenase E1 component subunit alpha [Planctomycetes bacterium]|nr:thiamine pyrophosphate-dependent dehydrogenase E1 component subunit alpha [Planctomycetota bacterium]